MILTAALLLLCSPSALLDFAIPQWKADKGVRIEDPYKWLFQAMRGGEHAAPDRESAKQWLDGEWASLAKADAKEPLWVPLCPGQEIGRLNLRAFKDAGGGKDDILDAFLTSSREYTAAVEAFTAAWNELGKRLEKHAFGEITLKAWTDLDAQMSAKGYPAVHHSESFNSVRHPSYRVITKAELVKLRAKLRRPAQ